eukprot:gene27288-36030_t
MLSVRAIDSAFRCAIVTGNIALIKLFLLPICLVNEFLVEQTFKQFCSLGEEPHIIEVLQSAVSPAVLAMAFRDQKTMRKSGTRRSSIYLVDPVESERLKTINVHIAEHQRKVSSLNSKIRHHAILHSQTWINDIFVEAAKNNNRLVILNLLRTSGPVKPSQYIINETFVEAVRETELSFAQLLISTSDNFLSIDQAGFNWAVEAAVQHENLVSFEWLLSGRFGFTPDQILMDNIFMTLFIERPCPIMNLLTNRITPGLKEQMEEDKAKIEAAKERLRRNKSVFQVSMNVDIHQYSRIQVQASSDEVQDVAVDEPGVVEGEIAEPVMPMVRANPRTTLNEAILANMKSRIVESPVQLPFLYAQVVRIIERILPPDDQDNALHVVAQVLTERSVPIFAVTLEFLQLLPADKTNIWIQGFLSESIVERSCNPVSFLKCSCLSVSKFLALFGMCVLQGALERVVTGLRGVGDSQLDAIFAQAEAPHLANIFLTGTFNIYGSSSDERSAIRASSNARSLARALVQRGAVLESTPETLTQLLREYAMEHIASLGENPAGYMDRINAVTEAVMDSFETHVQSYFEEAIQDSHQNREVGGRSSQEMDSALAGGIHEGGAR